MEAAWFSLIALVLVLGGLWLREYVCITMDARTYQQWVQDREVILEELEQSKNA